MYLREIKSSPALTSFVRCYRIIDFEFPNHDPIPPKAYTPRPEQCLQFFPTPTIIDCSDKGERIRPKNGLLIGQPTVMNKRTVFKKFLSLQIVFQPGALHRLLGFSMAELTDLLIDASDVFGNSIEEVNDQLYHAKDHLQIIAIAERFMLQLVKGTVREARALDIMASQMLDPQHDLDWYAANSFLSHRQFNRNFIDRMGISPKAYLKVVRFNLAYRMKNFYPEMSWFNIAIACGYHDYQHLSKDYQAFTGHSPAALFAMDSPERKLGTEEVY